MDRSRDRSDFPRSITPPNRWQGTPRGASPLAEPPWQTNQSIP